MRKLLPTLVLLLTCNFIFGQERTITGKVTTAEDPGGLTGVTVMELGTNNGTITDASGFYTITVDGNAILRYSFVGLLDKEVAVGQRTRIDVQLESDYLGLDEVVVVGYGVQKKSDLTGSVASITADEMNAVPTTNIAEMIRGNAAGVEVSLGNARPGGSSNIIIRGRKSLSGSNSPLYIVDGVPVGNINDINARDIESVEVLKDASAQSIYGARASNGVILLTTKRGKSGEMQVTYDASTTLQTIWKNFEVYGGDEWLEYRTQGFRSDAALSAPFIDTLSNWREYFPPEVILDEAMLESFESGEFVNWEDLVIDNAMMQQHNLSIRGGDENTRIATSFGYFDQDGLRPESSFQRGSFRLNFDQKATDWLSVGGNTYLARSFQTREASSAYYDYLYLPPLAQPYDENGDLQLYPTLDDRHRNPLFNNQESDRNITSNRLLLNVFADVSFLRHFNYRLNASTQASNSIDKEYLSTQHEKGRQYAVAGGLGGQASIGNANSFEYLVENILTFDKQLTQSQHLDITLMQSFNHRERSSNSVTTQNFNTDILGADGIADGTELFAPGNSAWSRRMISYMGRIRYNLMDKYLFSAATRIDGSSVFGANNKYAIFPSASVGWRIDKEDFMESFNRVNNLKLRASYGSIGNEAISPYQTQALTEALAYTFGSGETLLGYLPGLNDFPNADLRWETTTTFNSGLDFGFFKGRISGSLEYYISNTVDLLVNKQIANAYGFNRIMTNLGKTRNKGLELTMNSYLVSTDNMSWSVNLTYSRNRNEIVEIDGTVDEDGNPVNDIANRWFIGEPINVYYSYQFDGIWQLEEENILMPESRPGDVKLADINGDTTITAEDDRVILYRDPDWYGTIGTHFSFKGFEVSAVANILVGGVRYNEYIVNGNYGAAKAAFNAIKMDYWTPENPSNTYPRVYMDGQQSEYKSSYGYQDASYFRLRTVTLAYNFPVRISRALGLERLKLYATATNLLTITDYMSYSPEADPEDYPEGKNYTVGLSLTF
ncbi:MAG: TonB-dependent receptor [Bacteroidales bacterium]|nr:TonB-dependent receptor [Bacteroidales bacterium]